MTNLLFFFLFLFLINKIAHSIEALVLVQNFAARGLALEKSN
jgi:hypothetical protein